MNQNDPLLYVLAVPGIILVTYYFMKIMRGLPEQVRDKPEEHNEHAAQTPNENPEP